MNAAPIVVTAGFGTVALEIPTLSVPTGDLPERPSLAPGEQSVFDSTGIRATCYAPNTTETELAAGAGKRALSSAGIPPGDLDFVILLEGRRPEYLVASEAARLQHLLGAKNAVALSVAGLGCVSISGALQMARGLLITSNARHILIAGGSRPVSRRRYRHPVTIIGDGGGAVVVSEESLDRLLGLGIESDGDYWDLFAVRYSESDAADWHEECLDLKSYSFKLAVTSRNRFTILNRQILTAASVSASDVDHYVMQNISLGAFRFYEEALGVRFARACYDNLASYGHLGAVDILANIGAGTASGEFRPDDLVLVMNNSPVAAWSSFLVRI